MTGTVAFLQQQKKQSMLGKNWFKIKITFFRIFKNISEHRSGRHPNHNFVSSIDAK